LDHEDHEEHEVKRQNEKGKILHFDQEGFFPAGAAGGPGAPWAGLSYRCAVY
jgi:hypothetical protein